MHPGPEPSPHVRRSESPHRRLPAPQNVGRTLQPCTQMYPGVARTPSLHISDWIQNIAGIRSRLMWIHPYLSRPLPYLPGWCRWSHSPCPPSERPHQRQSGFSPVQPSPLESDRGTEMWWAGTRVCLEKPRDRSSFYRFHQPPGVQGISAWCSWSCLCGTQNFLERNPANNLKCTSCSRRLKLLFKSTRIQTYKDNHIHPSLHKEVQPVFIVFSCTNSSSTQQLFAGVLGSQRIIPVLLQVSPGNYGH